MTVDIAAHIATNIGYIINITGYIAPNSPVPVQGYEENRVNTMVNLSFTEPFACMRFRNIYMWQKILNIKKINKSKIIFHREDMRSYYQKRRTFYASKDVQ